MRVVPVDAPRLYRAIHHVIVSGASNVVHDFFAAIFLESFADTRTEGLQHFVPRSPSPLSAAPRTGTLHRIQDAIGIMNLSDGGGAFCTKASTARGMHRVAFELRNFARFLVDIGE